jgi:hypothetical protein
MDAPEPEQTPFAAVSAQTSRFARVRPIYISLNVSACPTNVPVPYLPSIYPIHPSISSLALSDHVD